MIRSFTRLTAVPPGKLAQAARSSRSSRSSRSARSARSAALVVLAASVSGALLAGLTGLGGPALAGAATKDKSSAGVTVEKPPTASLSETGSTLLYPLWNLWVPSYEKKYPKVTITTAGTGSGTGISDAAAGTVDIGSSDAYLSPSDKSSNPDLRNIPLAISAQFIAYNLPEISSKTHIKLNGDVLTEIYEGKVTKWNSSAIQDLNKGVKLPDIPIVTLHRSDGSGDTFLFTQYLSKTDQGWAAKYSYNTTVAWPNVSGALAEDGNSGMVSGCKSTVGCIAYIGISYLNQATGDKLGEAQLENAKKTYELPTATTIKAEADSFTSKTPANGTISLVYGSAKGGYPIVNYEYAIVSDHQSSSSTATAIRSVLEWSISPGYGNAAQFLNAVEFQPLPSSVVKQSAKQISQIR